jgi:hypothetical protein
MSDITGTTSVYSDPLSTQCQLYLYISIDHFLALL